MYRSSSIGRYSAAGSGLPNPSANPPPISDEQSLWQQSSTQRTTRSSSTSRQPRARAETPSPPRTARAASYIPATGYSATLRSTRTNPERLSPYSIGGTLQPGAPPRGPLSQLYQYGTSPAPYKSNPRLWSTQQQNVPISMSTTAPEILREERTTIRQTTTAVPIEILQEPAPPLLAMRSRSRSPPRTISRGRSPASNLFAAAPPPPAVRRPLYEASPLPQVLPSQGYQPIRPLTGRITTTTRQTYDRRSVSPPPSRAAAPPPRRQYSPPATLERTTVQRRTYTGPGRSGGGNGNGGYDDEFDRETIGSYRRAVGGGGNGGDSRFSSARSSRVATLPVGRGESLRRQAREQAAAAAQQQQQQQRPVSRERPVSTNSRRSTQSGGTFPRQQQRPAAAQQQQTVLVPVQRTTTTTTTTQRPVLGGGGGDRSPSTTSSGISSRPPAKEFVQLYQQKSQFSALPAAAAGGTLRRTVTTDRLQQSGLSGGAKKQQRQTLPSRIVTRMRVRESQSMEATKIMRLLFAAFNVLVFLCGLVLLGIGLWILITTWSYLQLSHYLTPYDTLEKLDHPNTVMQNGCYMFIVAGGLLTVLSVIGCIAAFRLNRLLLVVYAIMILLILVLEIVAAAYVAWNTPQRTAHEVLRNTLMITFERGYLGDAIVQGQDRTSELNYATFAWNALMRDLRCCGVNGSRDFLFDRLPPGYKANGNVPAACCMLNNTDYWWEPPLPIDRTCQTNPTEFNSWMHRGCYRVFWDFLITKTNIMLGVGIGIGFLLIVGILVSLCLIAAASTEYNERPRAVYTTRTVNGKNIR